MENKVVDHLFRHQYGKMVAILTRFFGLSQLATIEDAVQDTFFKAAVQWRNQLPENPEAWLAKAAKNRVIDLLRQFNAEKIRSEKVSYGSSAIHLNDLFLDHEIEDSQLRMLFIACHPNLDPKEQIAFALKTVAGFSTREISSALLVKEETIKKRLIRARKTIAQNKLKFEFPSPVETPKRVSRVLEIIYLTFNEGFHSNNKEKLIREDLCGEAIRLCKLLLKKEMFRSGEVYALFALMCFHSSRLESKTDKNNEIIDLKHQDRNLWHWPMIVVGNDAMNKAMEYEDISAYHYEAAIAAEHLKARTFEETNWQKILHWYDLLDKIHSSTSSKLNLAIVHLQLEQFETAHQILAQINPEKLEQRAYLYFGCFAEYHVKTGNIDKAIACFDQSILKVSNELERTYLEKKRNKLLRLN
jgi:RNA polymerase sigma factor (sigma-70 family)